MSFINKETLEKINDDETYTRVLETIHDMSANLDGDTLVFQSYYAKDGSFSGVPILNYTTLKLQVSFTHKDIEDGKVLGRMKEKLQDAFDDYLKSSFDTISSTQYLGDTYILLIDDMNEKQIRKLVDDINTDKFLLSSVKMSADHVSNSSKKLMSAFPDFIVETKTFRLDEEFLKKIFSEKELERISVRSILRLSSLSKDRKIDRYYLSNNSLADFLTTVYKDDYPEEVKDYLSILNI